MRNIFKIGLILLGLVMVMNASNEVELKNVLVLEEAKNMKESDLIRYEIESETTPLKNNYNKNKGFGSLLENIKDFEEKKELIFDFILYSLLIFMLGIFSTIWYIKIKQDIDTEYEKEGKSYSHYVIKYMLKGALYCGIIYAGYELLNLISIYLAK